MPLTMGAFVLGGLSLIGVPGTAGFISKWHLGAGAVADGAYLIVFLIVASSILAVLYVGRIIEVAYFRPPSPECAEATDPGVSMRLPIALMCAAVVYFGIETTYSAGIAREAAEALLGALKR